MRTIMMTAAVAATLLFTACGSSKQTATAQQSKAPFGKTYQLPCAVYDTDEVFAATGIYRGSSYQKGECQLNALENAKQQVYAKYHHACEGMISNYGGSIGNNRGNDISTKMNRATDQIVKVVLNDIQACCIEFGEVQDDGHIECYVGIKVPKKALAEQTAKAVADILTPEEKNQIGFEEYKYRKDMEERMQKYREQK